MFSLLVKNNLTRNNKITKCGGGGNPLNNKVFLASKAKKSNYKRINLSYYIFSLLFLTLLVSPIAFKLCKQDIWLNLVGENRNLTKAPNFKASPLKDLPKLWDQYFKDRLPFRQVFMPGYIFAYEKVLKTYVSEYVTGYGDELFMNHAAPVINANLEIWPYPLQAKEHVRLTAAGKYAYFLSKGIPYYLFVASDKSTLYPEFMPFYSNWIPHHTWYQEQIATLSKAHFKFYPLNDFFLQFKGKERLYDVMFDNCHWNGNALVHIYNYMAKTLAKDNPIFEPVAYGEYYGREKKQVTMSVYGKEVTDFITLGHSDDYSCSLAPEPYRTDAYNQYCVNKTKNQGSLWFFSDSYFGETHGSYGVTPFVHNVKHYLHRHYGMKKPFTQLAGETLSFNRPDAVIEEFVERMGGIQHTWNDPLLRVLGDFWMKTQGIFLDLRSDLTAFTLANAEFSGNALTVQPGSRLALKEPVTADDLGRVVVMGKVDPPADCALRIHYQEDGAPEQILDFGLPKAAPVFHQAVHVKPYAKVRLSVEFLTLGTYTLGQIKEIDDLKARM